jgi:hypothetical protein
MAIKAGFVLVVTGLLPLGRIESVVLGSMQPPMAAGAIAIMIRNLRPFD